jgi:predicted ATP-grasp superfamily ATP-dependent carboligase
MSGYPTVLILGVVPSLIWPVAQSITRAGGKPWIMAWHPVSPLKLIRNFGKYRTWKTVRKRGARIDPASLGEVAALCRENAIDMVIGADYDTAVLLAGHAAIWNVPACRVARQSTLETFNDKWNFTRLLDAIALPTPASQYISCEKDLRETFLTPPFITKPLSLWASVGFQVHHSLQELERTLDAGRLKSKFPLIAQSFVPGVDAGVSFLASHGKVAAYSIFHHRRRGYREFQNDQRVQKYVETFVEATHYAGVGHIDMRFDSSAGEYKILEINPRFWASLLYATQGGLNYPDMLVRLADWDGRTALTIKPRKVSLPFYERGMTVINRWCERSYERVSGATL